MNNFDKLGVMVDCSRNSVMTVSAVKKLIDMLVAMGYNTLQLYTEDTYEVNNEPYFGYLRGRYSKNELKDIDSYAVSKGMELIPCIQTLAHLNQFFRWSDYWKINDCNDIILVGDERTYQLLDNMFATLAECFTSRRVNIGMDEAHMLGLGRYLDQHGYTNRSELMLSHLEKVNEIAAKYGFRCAMWGDMFFRMAFGEYYYLGDEPIPDEIKNRVPKDIDLIYWDYYGTEKARYDGLIKKFQSIGNNTVFAGCAWTLRGLVPINRMGIESCRPAIKACRENGVREAFVTMWGDDGGSCSPFSVLPALYAVSEFAKGNDDMKQIKCGFERLTGMPFDIFMYADLPNVLKEGQPLDRNPSKYLFYNDCLLGIFDSTINEGDGRIFLSHSKKLRQAEKYKDWTFLFKPLRTLCDALYYKADLGVRTRTAYKKNDKEEIKALLDTAYKPLVRKVKVFYKAFAAYWEEIYKPHGFDIMDMRIGSVLQRLASTMQKLSDYASGKRTKIEELDEQLLDYFGGGTAFRKDTTVFNQFAATATVNVLRHPY